MKMKKLIVLALALFLVLAIAACNDSGNTPVVCVK